jgi:hypothetical protein
LKIQVIHGSKIAERMIIDYRKKENRMKTNKDIFDIFLNDENYRYIMKRLLEASMEESFNSVLMRPRNPRPLGVVRGNRFYQIACSW